MAIPQSFLDELRQRTTLSTIIQETDALKKAGREWKACCPFHSEKSPSFTVNDDKGFYHCFGCQAHGDVISWMVEQRGLSFIDAVKELASRAGLEMPAQDPRQAEREQERDRLIRINERAAAWFASNLKLDAAADTRAYIEQRSISRQSIDKFRLGFSLPSRPGTGSLLSKGVGMNDLTPLVQLGLVKKSPDSDDAYDFFRRRLMIPIDDARGNCIGFGARIIGKGEPKYLNSPDTPVFDKGSTLFNLHRAAQPARREQQLLVVEGYLDVIGVDAVGIENVVAPNGTALTQAQMRKMWRIVDEPTLCFDGDPAGRKAAVRAARSALEIMVPGKSFRFAFPDDGKDPDDMAREGGRDAILALIGSSIPLIDVIWRDLLDRYGGDNPDMKARMRTEAREIVRSITNPDLRASYGEAFRGRFSAENSRQTFQRSVEGATVSDALQDAIVVGLFLYPEVLDDCIEDALLIKWVRPEHRKLVDLATELQDLRCLDKAQLASALEAVDCPVVYESALQRSTLRMPWMPGSKGQGAIESLKSSIRGLARRGNGGRR